MKYKNHIPSVDDERVSKTYSVVFNFPENVSHKEAVQGINHLLEKHKGKIPNEWVRMGGGRQKCVMLFRKIKI